MKNNNFWLLGKTSSLNPPPRHCTGLPLARCIRDIGGETNDTPESFGTTRRDTDAENINSIN